MNISYNWLKEYVDFDLAPEELAHALTSIGLETGTIEESESIKGGLEGLYIGEVLTCADHPDSDHLHITTVDVGQDAPLQIVCGAPNVAAGQKVVVAVNGTKLYSGDQTFTIKKSKIRGVESNGMICAEDEIGIGTSHEGIIVLPQEAKVGTPAKTYYKVEKDYVLEVDITPNRSDAISHFGVARDLAAYLKQAGKNVTLRKPDVSSFSIDNPAPAIEVTVENHEACPRYSGITIKGVKVGESPDWLKKRLVTIGSRPINNVVDVTNYILHELGQPLHAFDLNEIKGGKVIVKTLPEGTEFITLDGITRKLSNKDLMICNNEGGMCIGGVLGGLESGVTENTTDVFLESAYFHPTWIRKTARRHGISTDSSFRFERGCDPNNTVYVLKRAALLIRELAGGEITGEIQDVYPQPIENAQVRITQQKIDDLIGKKIPVPVIKSILDSLEIKILSEENGSYKLSIPTYRTDVKKDVDVIEDILRIYGYNQVEIEEKLNSTLSYETPTDKSYALQNLISEQLTGYGYHEIMNNSFSASTNYAELETYPQERCVKIKNAVSAELDVLRQTLLFGGLESIRYNRNRQNNNLKFYEFGNVYSYREEKKKEDNPLSAFKETFKLGIWLSGNDLNNNWIQPIRESSVFDLKAIVENIFLRLGIPGKKITVKQYSNEIFAAGLSLDTVTGKHLGEVGIIRKTLLNKYDIGTDVFFAELDWEMLMKEIKANQVKFSPVSKFPMVKRDLALLIDKSVQFSEIEKIATDTDKKLLKEVVLFDVYEGKNLPEGKKSYAVSFYLQDKEKTLNDKQIDNLMKRIQQNLETKLNASLR